MKITLERGDYGFLYLLVAEDGREILIQSDWDYPGTASTFGWVPCECGRTTEPWIACTRKRQT